MWQDTYYGKRVLITGHTGFKGSWLSYMFIQVRADVTDFVMAPRCSPNLFEMLHLENCMKSYIGDIADLKAIGRSSSKDRAGDCVILGSVSYCT